jgi:hypothetical protein
MAVITIEIDDADFARALAEATLKLAPPIPASPQVNYVDPATPPQAAPQAPQQPEQADPWESSTPAPQVPQAQAQAPVGPPAQQYPGYSGDMAAGPGSPPPAQYGNQTKANWPQPGTYNIKAPSGPQTWQIGAPNAPACLCGEAAAYVTGQKKKGGTFNAWRCALSGNLVTENDWKKKCTFSKFA